MKVKTLDWS